MVLNCKTRPISRVKLKLSLKRKPKSGKRIDYPYPNPTPCLIEYMGQNRIYIYLLNRYHFKCSAVFFKPFTALFVSATKQTEPPQSHSPANSYICSFLSYSGFFNLRVSVIFLFLLNRVLVYIVIIIFRNLNILLHCV